MNGINGIPNFLPMFDGKNWIRWRKQMKSLFDFHETLELVTDGVPVLAANASGAQKTSHNEVKKKDCKVAYYIQSAVDFINFERISHAESAKEAWDILVKYYDGGEKVKVVKLQTLRQQYELLSMGEDKQIVEYVSKVQKVVHLIKSCSETLTDKMIVDKVMSIQESNQLKTLKLEDLVGSLEAQEIRIFERKGVQDSIKALQVHSWKKNGGSNKFKSKVDKTRRKKPWKDNGSTKGKDEGANLARQDLDDSEGMMVMAAVEDNHVESKIWFLDSGFTNHMTGQNVWLADFDESKKSKVKLADNSLLQVEGTGNIVEWQMTITESSEGVWIYVLQACS
ncbi:uncharacterized protein LOC131658624 [Vicia villosa]|uniref:uncharacterized protein LOC131658624 n=1 Tax=Vicia villosa TaxID=3911 RepID=UPI00273C8C65|nr:uncharacterized protein LOC131658624 [Vicia villosa]